MRTCAVSVIYMYLEKQGVPSTVNMLTRVALLHVVDQINSTLLWCMQYWLHALFLVSHMRKDQLREREKHHLYEHLMGNLHCVRL